MTQKLAAALVAAVLLCGGAAIASAQDQTPANPPAAGDTSATGNTGTTGETGTTAKPKHKKGMRGMDACKDDVAKLCPDAKGHKAVHACLDQHKDELSAACKEHHEKMEKRWSKKHKKGHMEGSSMPSSGGTSNPGGAAPAGGTPPPTNP